MANEFQQAPQQPMGPQPGFQPQRQGTPMVDFVTAVKRGIAGLMQFEGRSRRSEYWWFALAVGVCTGILSYIFRSFEWDAAWKDAFSGGNSYLIWDILYRLSTIAGFALLLAVNIRRLNDAGKPSIIAWITAGLQAGGMIIGLLSGVLGGILVIIGWIVAIVNFVFCVMDSVPGPNEHGPSEKYPM